MAQGKSGRIIIDVDPEFKEELYVAVRAQGFSSMKEWFVQQAERVCEESKQPSLGLVAEDQALYSTNPNH
jgi:heat shock protein HspQ